MVLIALGESVVAIGVGAAGLELGPGLITAVLLGITVVACLWWSYFDWLVYVAQTRLAEETARIAHESERNADDQLARRVSPVPGPAGWPPPVGGRSSGPTSASTASRPGRPGSTWAAPRRGSRPTNRSRCPRTSGT
ncbi:MAG: low temperature requirement protein A [Actinobacteria bacterium]|nr:low temperature requirement protein A [Actinomycetota bacterium]